MPGVEPADLVIRFADGTATRCLHLTGDSALDPTVATGAKLRAPGKSVAQTRQHWKQPSGQACALQRHPEVNVTTSQGGVALVHDDGRLRLDLDALRAANPGAERFTLAVQVNAAKKASQLPGSTTLGGPAASAALSGNLAVHDGALWLQMAGAADAKVMDLPVPATEWPLVEEYGGTGSWTFGTLIADNPVQRQLFVSTSGAVPATALAWSVDDNRSGNRCTGSGRYRLVDFK